MSKPHVSKRTSVRVTDSQVDTLIKTYGFDELEQIFAKLANDDKRTIMMNAFKKALKPLVEQARINAPLGPPRKGNPGGNLKKSIGLLELEDRLGMFAGARRGGKTGSNMAGWHGHLLNDGTVDRFYISKKGVRHNTGKMSVSSSYFGWFTRAAEATEEQAINVIAEEWYKSVARFEIKGTQDR